ncbi:hypothetical protein P2W49_11845 [Yersinia intermedia]|nr:hypothetical protein P2W49_11845 [Yersinia intermedia]
MSLNVVNPFSQPLEIWSYRPATQQEGLASMANNGFPILNVRDQLITVISDMPQAASYLSVKHLSKKVSDHITGALKSDLNFKNWRNAMPSKTPQNLINYQNSYPPANLALAASDVSQYGVILPDEQILFHGGIWPLGQLEINTNRVFSTTFCPEIALNNAVHLGKAFCQGYIDLIVVKLKNVSTKAYVFNPSRGSKKHEKEVLFNSGATLKLINRQLASNNYPVGLNGTIQKHISVYIVNAELS